MKCGGENENVHYLFEGKSIFFQLQLLKTLGELWRKLSTFIAQRSSSKQKPAGVYCDNPFGLNIGAFMKMWASPAS